MFRKYAKGGLRIPEGGFTPKFNNLAAPVPRPCEVDGKVCTFHRFIDEDRALLRINGFTTWQEREKLYADFKERGVCPACCTIETVRRTWALVEYPDGSLGKVAPEEVCFLDKEH